MDQHARDLEVEMEQPEADDASAEWRPYQVWASRMKTATDIAFGPSETEHSSGAPSGAIAALRRRMGSGVR
ncbi:MAG: hypothetical protein AAF610_07750 [Pseudomonadota bacterium]